MFDRRNTFRIFYFIPLFWMSLFFLVPLLLMVAISFRKDIQGEIFQLWMPTIVQYKELFSVGSYLRLLGISAGMALVIALTGTILAYPIAYFLAFRAGARAGRYLILLLVPFWTSYLLRVMALKLMLGSDGAINSFLEYIGLINAP